MARKQRLNVSMVKTADKEQSADWDFPVYQEELITSKGVMSGIHAVVRGDNHAVIGQYRGQKVIPYRDLTEAFETGLQDAGLKFDRSLITTANGARFFARYNVGNGLHINGEGFNKIFSLQSSYNGSLTHGYEFEVERLKCLNRMTGFVSVHELYRKHSVSLKADFIAEDIHNAIENGEKNVKEVIEKMAAIEIGDGDAQNILSNIVQKGALSGVSERTAHLINHNWRNPSADESPLGNTLYRLYNAATRFSRDVATVGRFEMSRKANIYLTGAFDLAARRSTDLNALLATPIKKLDFDAVTVNN